MTALEEFMELAAIDSDSRHERAMADRLTAKLREIGCDVWEDPASAKAVGGDAGILYAVLPATRGAKSGAVMFCSHMDRVANGHNIRPVVDGDVVHAQGTILAADDLAGVTAILNGLRRLVASGAEHAKVEVLFSVCEEDSVTGSRYIDYSRLESKIGYVFDLPGRVGRFVNKAPAKAHFDVSVRGRTAHAGNAPETGINAVTAAAKALLALPDGRVDAETTMNVSQFEAETPTNIVNDFARFSGEVRSRDEKKFSALLERIKTVCDETARLTGANFSVSTRVDYHSFDVPENSNCLSIAHSACEALGIGCVVNAGGGGLDANHINCHGIECVGVATGYQDNHTTRETLRWRDMDKAADLFVELVKEFSSRG